MYIIYNLYIYIQLFHKKNKKIIYVNKGFIHTYVYVYVYIYMYMCGYSYPTLKN